MASLEGSRGAATFSGHAKGPALAYLSHWPILYVLVQVLSSLQCPTLMHWRYCKGKPPGFDKEGRHDEAERMRAVARGMQQEANPLQTGAVLPAQDFGEM